MSNDINNLFPGGPRRSGAAANPPPARESRGGTQASPAATPSSNEKVTLTDAARKLASLSAEAAMAPEVDQAKVNRLREAVQSGLYQPDPKAIADALIRFEQDS